MKFLILFLSLAFTSVSFARPYKLVELNEASVEAYDILAKRDHYFPEMENEDWGSGANFNLNVTFMRHMFWNNRIHLSSDQTQIRHVGYEFKAGFHIIHNTLDIYYHHHSEHATESLPPADLFKDSRRQFPVQDYVGFKIYFFTDRK